MPFAKNVGKTVTKNVNSKYSQKLLGHAKQSATDAPKTASKKANQKTVETTGDLISNKTAYLISSLKNFITEQFRNK